MKAELGATSGLDGLVYTRPRPALTAPPLRLLTFQQLSEGLGARRRDGEGQLVHGDAVSNGQRVDLSVRDLAGQQLPQQHPETATSPKKEKAENG